MGCFSSIFEEIEPKNEFSFPAQNENFIFFSGSKMIFIFGSIFFFDPKMGPKWTDFGLQNEAKMDPKWTHFELIFGSFLASFSH